MRQPIAKSNASSPTGFEHRQASRTAPRWASSASRPGSCAQSPMRTLRPGHRIDRAAGEDAGPNLGSPFWFQECSLTAAGSALRPLYLVHVSSNPRFRKDNMPTKSAKADAYARLRAAGQYEAFVVHKEKIRRTLKDAGVPNSNDLSFAEALKSFPAGAVPAASRLPTLLLPVPTLPPPGSDPGMETLRATAEAARMLFWDKAERGGNLRDDICWVVRWANFLSQGPFPLWHQVTEAPPGVDAMAYMDMYLENPARFSVSLASALKTVSDDGFVMMDWVFSGAHYGISAPQVAAMIVDRNETPIPQ